MRYYREERHESKIKLERECRQEGKGEGKSEGKSQKIRKGSKILIVDL